MQGLQPCLVHISSNFKFCTKGGIYVSETFLVLIYICKKEKKKKKILDIYQFVEQGKFFEVYGLVTLFQICEIGYEIIQLFNLVL